MKESRYRCAPSVGDLKHVMNWDSVLKDFADLRKGGQDAKAVHIINVFWTRFAANAVGKLLVDVPSLSISFFQNQSLTLSNTLVGTD